jgi:propanol-preferring alcohol dehydrogenase
LPIQWPRVPGHEAVGRIDAIGEDVQGWAVGQRVGVGFLGGSCGYCEYCRDGDLVNCKNQSYTGVQEDGGYAESMIAKSSGLMSVPDDLSSVDAAPLLCAGLTTFSALAPAIERNSRKNWARTTMSIAPSPTYPSRSRLSGVRWSS